jgi:phosphate transport system ATP-binding protein
MVFQAPNPLPKSISANVAYGLRAQGQHDDRKIESIVEESLRKANLWDEVAYRLDTSALSLSGGQQQRLCIARALAVEPEIILMDEPASSLDPLSAGQIEDLLFELKKEFTVVIVTHNMEEAARIGDMTAFFLNGYLVEVGETKAIFTDPERKETSDYITGRFG